MLMTYYLCHAASICMLQNMLDIRSSVSHDLRLSFDCIKSHCIVIGSKRICGLGSLVLDGKQLEWVVKLNYHGVVLTSDHVLSVCLDSARQKYFAAVNALNAHCKYAAEPIKLQLYDSYCLPILLYGIDCINLCASQVHDLNVCWNSAYRKILGYKHYESVKNPMYYATLFAKKYDRKQLNKRKKKCPNNTNTANKLQI